MPKTTPKATPSPFPMEAQKRSPRDRKVTVATTQTTTNRTRQNTDHTSTRADRSRHGNPAPAAVHRRGTDRPGEEYRPGMVAANPDPIAVLPRSSGTAAFAPLGRAPVRLDSGSLVQGIAGFGAEMAAVAAAGRTGWDVE